MQPQLECNLAYETKSVNAIRITCSHEKVSVRELRMAYDSLLTAEVFEPADLLYVCNFSSQRRKNVDSNN